jgi:hypothetical protein
VKDLSRDEYLELITTYIPIEIATDREGDCDDKSPLHVGLLSLEGYVVYSSPLRMSCTWR